MVRYLTWRCNWQWADVVDGRLTQRRARSPSTHAHACTDRPNHLFRLFQRSSLLALPGCPRLPSGRLPRKGRLDSSGKRLLQINDGSGLSALRYSYVPQSRRSYGKNSRIVVCRDIHLTASDCRFSSRHQQGFHVFWGCVLLGCLTLLFIPIPFVLYKVSRDSMALPTHVHLWGRPFADAPSQRHHCRTQYGRRIRMKSKNARHDL